MNISKEIVEDQLGGTVELVKTVYEQDEPGKGSAMFRIIIPEKEMKENES